MGVEGGDELEAFFVRIPELSSSSATAPRIHAVIHPRSKPLGKFTEWILGSGPEDDDGGGWRVTMEGTAVRFLPRIWVDFAGCRMRRSSFSLREKVDSGVP